MNIPLHVHNPARTYTRHDYVNMREPTDQVLVVVFLRGGADGLTLVPPLGDDGYAQARPMLAVKKADALDLDGYFALNASLSPLLKYFRDGELAIVHGAGSEDHTRSHFEAQDFMEHGGDSGMGSGWLARYLRARSLGEGSAASALSAVAIGSTQPESLRGAPGGAVMQSVEEFSFGDDDPSILQQLAALYAVETGPLGQAAQDTIEAVKRLREVRSRPNVSVSGAAYPETTFGRGLREIAKLIKADVGLVTTTIDHAGLSTWDTHFVQQQLIGDLMSELAAGIDAFVTDLGAESQRVTIVTMTEFGRRLRENTSFGTDHGAGSVMMTLAPGRPGAFQGGTVRSGWKDLSPSNLDEIGDVPAAINYRDVLAPILRSHSPQLRLENVFPGHMLA